MITQVLQGDNKLKSRSGRVDYRIVPEGYDVRNSTIIAGPDDGRRGTDQEMQAGCL